MGMKLHQGGIPKLSNDHNVSGKWADEIKWILMDHSQSWDEFGDLYPCETLHGIPCLAVNHNYWAKTDPAKTYKGNLEYLYPISTPLSIFFIFSHFIIIC